MERDRLLRRVVVGAVALFVLLQMIPYGRNHQNPPVVAEPQWDSPSTRELVKRGCFDCHSHETRWPWYSRVAPSSWLVYYDVVTARGKLNFSDWQDGILPGENPKLIQRLVTSGAMPPFRYRILHPEARLSEREKESLIEGLLQTMGGG